MLPIEYLAPKDFGEFEIRVQTGMNIIEAALQKMSSGYFREVSTPLKVLAVASLLSHALKPYGHGTAPDIRSMLTSQHLDCSNYGLFTIHIAKQILPDFEETLDIRFVGWESEAIGNHQMVFAKDKNPDNQGMILDPTTGVVAKGGFDPVASGRSVKAVDLIIFPQQPLLENAREQVVSALTEGLLKPSEILYYFESSNHLLNCFGSAEDWPTPGSVDWRDKYSSRGKPRRWKLDEN